MALSGQAEDVTKALESLGVVSQVAPGHSCSVVCGCIVKRGPKQSQLGQAGLGFAGMLLLGACAFHHILSIHTMFPSLQVCLHPRPLLLQMRKQSCCFGRPPMFTCVGSSLVLVSPGPSKVTLVGSQCWALADTRKGRMVKDEENKTREEHNSSSID